VFFFLEYTVDFIGKLQLKFECLRLDVFL